ncbi:MAG: MbnP family protein [Candidatus Sumerlaeota bacterium]
MKTLREQLRRLSAAAATGLMLVSSHALADPAPTQRRITIPIHHVFRDKALEFHKPGLTLVDGSQIEITRLEYLISNVRLQRADGSWIVLSDQYFHVNAGEDQKTITLAGVDGNESLRGVMLTIGLDEKTNHADSTKWPDGHALNPLENNLNWDWKGGYVFLAIEGRIQPADPRRPAFLYHVGGDKNRMDVQCALAKATALRDLQFTFSIDQLWDGQEHVSLTQESTFTHSRDGDELAPKLAKNASRAFTITTPGEVKK